MRRALILLAAALGYGTLIVLAGRPHPVPPAVALLCLSVGALGPC